MVLNWIWIGMFVVSIGIGFIKLLFFGDYEVMNKMMDGLFESSKGAFEIALFMTGTLCLWMGFMKIGEEGGAVKFLTKLTAPLFSRLFPQVPREHPAMGSIMMNFSANMLGLDNAATPFGLKAMNDLQTLNQEDPKTASNAQIMFLVLNTSGLTIIPVSILAFRAANNSNDVSSVFIPILITTFCATLAGLIFVSIRQKINLFDKVIFAYFGSIAACIISLVWVVHSFPEKVNIISSILSNTIILGIILGFFILAIRSKVNVFESFIEGAKGGFDVALSIMPYLIAMLVAISLFRNCGAMEDLMEGIKIALTYLGILTVQFVDALPVILMKPFSGAGARGLMVDIFQNPSFGPDSFVGKLASTFQGSTDTTFFVLAVYFGSVKITRTRYAALAGLFCDLIGGIVALLVAYLFFG